MLKRIFEVQYTYTNPLDYQRARALLVVSAVLGAAALVAGVPIGIASSDVGVPWTVASLLLIAIASYILVQRGALRVAGGLFVVALIAASFFPNLDEGITQPIVIMFTLPVVTAALLMGGIWTWVASGLSGAAMFALAWLQIDALGGLATEEGEHLLILAVSAEMMLVILAAMSWGLARALTRWASDAQRRSEHLAATLAVGRVASTVYDLEAMLTQVAEATRDQFGIYHAHIYLYDQDKDQLEMVAGSGEAGRTMREMDHALKPGQGIVGRVYRTGEPFLAEDVAQAPDWLPNPLLPETRSELTVPITSSAGVIGVLDMQSDAPGGFGEGDLDVAGGLANQLGVALQNLQLLVRTREQAQFTQTLLNNLAEGIVAFDLDYSIIEANPAFERMIGHTKDNLLRRSFQQFVSPDHLAIQEEALAALRRQETVAPLEMEYLSKPGTPIPVRVNMALLRNLQDAHVGYIASVQDITEERVARVRQEMASEVSRQFTSVLDIETLLRDLVTTVQERLGYYHVHVYLFEDENLLRVAEGTGEAGRQMKAGGHNIPVDAELSLVARAARARQSVVVNDTRKDPGFLPNPLLPETRAEVAIPLVVSGRVVGVLDIQHSKVGHFTQGEVLTLEGLANQLGIAIQNADLFSITQRALADTALLLLSVRRMLDAQDEAEAYDVLAGTIGAEGEVDRILIGTAWPEQHYPPKSIQIVSARGWDERAFAAGQNVSYGDWPYADQIDGALESFVCQRGVPESYQRVSAKDRAHLDDHDVNSALLIPLTRGRRFFGLVLIETCGDRTLSDDQMNVSRSLCEQMSVVLENYYLLSEAREAQERYYSLYHGAPAGYHLLDATGLLVEVNQTELSWLGYDAEEVVGVRYFWELMTPDSQLTFQEALHQIVEGGAQEDTELELLRKDGSVLPVRGTSTGVHDDDGNVTGIRGVLIDISEEREREAREQLAYQLGQQVSSVLETERLLQEVVDQLALTFGYYHAHVYLVDEDLRTLKVKAGTGSAGAEMKAAEHSIPLSAEVSLVADAASHLEAVVIQDVTQEPRHLPNPLLPDTLSEAAVPLRIGERLLGVLDVQHHTAGHFTPPEIHMLESLASQISVALDNARLFDQVQDSMESTATLLFISQRALAASKPLEIYELLLSVISQSDDADRITIQQAGPEFTLSAEYTELIAAWNRTEDLEQVGDKVGTRYPRARLPLTTSEASRSEPGIYDVASDERIDEELRKSLLGMGIRRAMQLPLAHGANWFGEVVIESHRQSAFTSADVALYTAIADQAAVALQNLLLLEQMERSLGRERLAQTLTQRMSMQLDPELVLQDVVDQLTATFGYYHAHIYVLSEDADHLTVAAGTGEAGVQLKAMGHSISPDAEVSLVAEAVRTMEPVVVDDVSSSASHLPNPLLPLTRSEVAVPIRAGERPLGVLDVQHDHTSAFDEAEVRTLQVVANQVAAALSNAELFAEIQFSLEREHLAHELTRQLATQLDPDQLLQGAVESLAETFGYYHAHVYTLAGDGKTLVVGAGLGEAGAQLKAMGHSIPLDAEVSLVAQAARATAPIVIDDVASSPSHLPNPLLPLTRAEAAVPLQAGGRLMGVLDVQHDRVGGFGETEMRTLQVIAGQMAVALTNAELFREMGLSLEREHIAYQLAQRLTTLLEPEQLLQEIVDQLAETFGYYYAHIYTLTEDGENLAVAAGLGEAGDIMRDAGHSIPLAAEVSVVAEAARTMAPVVVDDVTLSPVHLPNPLLPETRAEVAVPLYVGGRLIGVLDVQHKERGHFSEPEVRTLQVIANQASVALSNAELYQEQIQITERLREVDLLKSEFLATMSHELRTPLNSIIGYSELLIDEVGPTLDEMSREDLEAIHSSSHHLLAIINDILDLAKIEAGRLALDRAEIDLKEFLPEIVEMSRVLLENKPVELRLELAEELPSMRADQTRLRQIIWNLLSNAIKFTEEGEVVVGCHPSDGWMHFFIHDTGVGIAPEHQAIIFDRFRQVDGSLTRKKGGTGLGLAITRHLVEMHGGKIWVESEMGDGTTFYVDIPLERTPEKTSKRTDGRGGNGSGGDGASARKKKAGKAKGRKK